MRFLEYGQQKFPMLFYGLCDWPKGFDVDWLHGKQPFVLPQLPMLEPQAIPDWVIATEHQTAGVACNHKKLLGVFWEIPPSHRFYALAEQLALGYESMGALGVSFDELLSLHALLKTFGLELDNVLYTEAEEAFFPFHEPSDFVDKDLADLVPIGWTAALPIDLLSIKNFLEQLWDTFATDSGWLKAAASFQFYNKLGWAILTENSD